MSLVVLADVRHVSEAAKNDHTSLGGSLEEGKIPGFE